MYYCCFKVAVIVISVVVIHNIIYNNYEPLCLKYTYLILSYHNVVCLIYM